MGTKSTSGIPREPQTEAGVEPLLRHSDQEAQELLELAIRVKQLAPWQWMEETDLVGIESPETGEIGFISVMGSVGEYEAVALYLDAEGFYGFLDFVEDETATADRLLETPHLQAAFSERKYLEKWDRDLIRQLGMKVARSQASPIFRSYRPGYLPWFVTLPEARFLIHALSQIIGIATRLRDGVQPFNPTGRIDQGGYLMRVSRKAESGLIWEDQVWQIPRPKAEPVRALVDSVVFEQLKRIPQSQHQLEADFLLAPGRIGAPGERPLAPYMLMVADSESRFILGCDVMAAGTSLAATRASLPNCFAKILLQNRISPRRVVVRSEWLRNLLKTLTQSLNIELIQSGDLPSIDEAASSMREWMRTGRM
jgi:hypothetical protein